MIYSPDDVKRLLDEIWERCSKPINEGGPAFFYKNDNLPPRVLLESLVADILNEVKAKL